MKAGNASLKTKMKEVFESVHPPGGESDVVPGTSNKKLAFGNSVKDYSLGKEGKPAAGSPRKPVRRNSSKSAMSARDFQLQKQRNSCLEFVLVIVFMIGFLTLMWIHEDIAHIYELEHVMELTLTKKAFGAHSHTFKDVKDVVELWEWLDLGLLPTLVKHTDPIGHLLPHEDWGYLAKYNRVIGGLRITQHRSEEHHCHYEELSEFYGECQPLGTTDSHSYGYPDCSDHAAVADYLVKIGSTDDDEDVHMCYNASDYAHAVDIYHDEGFSFDEETKQFEMWIDLFDTKEVIKKRIDYLKDRHWIDKQTTDVTFSLLFYNGQGEPLVCEALLKFLFSRAGNVIPEVHIETVTISPYFAMQAVKLCLEILFVGILLHLLYTEFSEIRSRRIQKKALLIWAGAGKNLTPSWLQAFIEHYWSGDEPLSNIVDAVTVGLGIWITCTWIQVTVSMTAAEYALKHLHRPEGDVAYDDTDHDIWSVYHHEVIHAEHKIQAVIYGMVSMRRLAFFMVMLMIFLMFKTWDGIPAMQGVSATVMNASARLFSFGIIIICLLTLFAGGAMLAFGQQMEEFHTFTDAFLSTLIVMTSGSEDIYQDQLEIDKLLASLWHWLLVGIMYVVCLNLLLCILVDAYGESRAQRAEMDKDHILPTLYEQTVDAAWYCGESMREQVMSSFRESGSDSKRIAMPKQIAPPQDATSAAKSMLARHQSKKIGVIQEEAVVTPPTLNSKSNSESSETTAEEFDEGEEFL